jgi:tetratricopeptide (TPR) repeat protein
VGDETAVWQGRHAEYFLALAEEAAPAVASGERNNWAALLVDEHDNLRAALRRLIVRGASEPAVRLAGALGRFWRWQQHYGEGRQWLEEALALRPEAPAAARARALDGLGALTRNQGDYAAARAALEESRTLFNELGDRGGYARTLQDLGLLALNHEEPPDYARATALFEECLAAQRELDSSRGVIVVLNDLGTAAFEQGEYGRAWDYFEDVLARARALRFERMITIACSNLAIVGLMQGEDARSWACLAETLKRIVLPEDSLTVAYMLAVLAGLVSRAGWPEGAARLAGASEGVCAAIGFTMPAEHRARFDRQVARAQLDDAAWATAWAEGAALTVEQALALALAQQ